MPAHTHTQNHRFIGSVRRNLSPKITMSQDKIETIRINNVEYVRADQVKAPTLSNRVIVRCSGAGVHVGTLVEKDGDTITLRDANRLFYFKSATPRKAMFSLSEVAMQGLCRKQSRIGTLLPTITLRDWCEIIPVAEGIDLSEVNND